MTQEPNWSSLIRPRRTAVVSPPRPQQDFQGDDGDQEDGKVETVADLPRVASGANLDPDDDVNRRKEERKPAYPVVVPVPEFAVLGVLVGPQEDC